MACAAAFPTTLMVIHVIERLPSFRDPIKLHPCIAKIMIHNRALQIISQRHP